MKKLIVAILVACLTHPFISTGQKNLPSTPEREIMAAKQVVMRLIGMKAESFLFEKIPSENGLDVYEVIALKGKVQVKGSSTIAMTRGAYDYLKKACNIQYTWSTDKVTPPSSLPDLILPRTVSPYKYRLYYNVCAFGYSTAFWKWEDWQRELDWMALHGINMPLAMAGQEAIWQKVFKDMGMTDQELRSYFVGPAFLPWQRMGNINNHDGPLPQSYIDASRDIQKQLILRMQQLGMLPVVPAFSGFVPPAYKRLYPESKLLEVKGWCNFPDTNQTYLLPPGSSDFITIGKRFIEEYHRTYGTVHHYLADLFNENEVPVSEAGKLNELADFGKSVHDAIQAADPEGTWVMQGWLFNNNQQFWTKEAVRAFLSKVPDDKMMIIDLANEEFHGWEKLGAFYGKPWIYSTIHNYGGNNQLLGNLPLYAVDAATMLTNPQRGNVAGFGISPEGINNNEVVYELLTDVAWTSKPIDIKGWLQSYVKQRYGEANDPLFHAWLGLLETVYNSSGVHPQNAYQRRPSLSPESDLPDLLTFDHAVATFLYTAETFKDNPRFKNDLIQLVVQFAGNKTDMLLKRALYLHESGLKEQSQEVFGRVKELMLMMDALTHLLPQQRMETWTESARKWGKTREESDYYEANAKRQVTQWGNRATPVLFEYASKVWSGLIRDYYLNRWMLFADGLKRDIQPDLYSWEENWISTPGLRSKAPLTGDYLTYARTLYNTAGEYAVQYGEQVKIQARNTGKGEVEVAFTVNHTSADQVFNAVPVITSKKEKKVPAREEKGKPATASNPEIRIVYTTDGSAPGFSSSLAEKPVKVTLPVVIRAAAFYGNKPLGGETLLELPVSFGKQSTLNPLPSPKYMAKTGVSITDGIRGSANFTDGNWLGYEGENLHATINLEQNTKIKEVQISYLENGNSWIFGPSALLVHTSTDGVVYSPVYTHDFDTHYWSMTASKRKFTATFPETEAKYVRVSLYNQGVCPQGSPCEGKKCWLFADEIIIR